MASDIHPVREAVFQRLVQSGLLDDLTLAQVRQLADVAANCALYHVHQRLSLLQADQQEPVRNKEYLDTIQKRMLKACEAANDPLLYSDVAHAGAFWDYR